MGPGRPLGQLGEEAFQDAVLEAAVEGGMGGAQFSGVEGPQALENGVDFVEVGRVQIENVVGGKDARFDGIGEVGVDRRDVQVSVGSDLFRGDAFPMERERAVDGRAQATVEAGVGAEVRDLFRGWPCRSV